MAGEREQRLQQRTGDEIRVLHVDDKRDFVEASAEHLEMVDGRLEVTIETDAESALGRLDDGVDCIVSDYQMPGMNGLEFLSAVDDRPDGPPFILFTGKGSEKVASEALSAGASDYLQKGIGGEQYEILANRIVNAVERRRANERAEMFERIQRLVGDIERVLVRAHSQSELETRVCETLSAADPYQFAWVGGVDEETSEIRPRASAGIERGYLDEITVTADDGPTGQGPGGRALREQEVAVSQDITADSTFEPWQSAASERNFRAVAAVPLSYQGTQYGVLGVYADRTGAFSDVEQQILADLGDDIAHALDSLRTRRRLREVRDRRAALFDSAPDPVIAGEIDEGTDFFPITDVNPAFESVFDFDAEAVIGEDVADVVVPAAGLSDHEAFRERVVAGETVQTEVERITASGPQQFLLTVIPYGNGSGPTGWYAWYTDLSDQREREAKLREREAALRTAHEVTAAADIPFEAQIEELLELGNETLGTEYATFTNVTDEEFTFEVVDVPDDAGVNAGASSPADEMPFCARVVDRADRLVHSNAHPAGDFDETDIDRYLGAPIRVDGDVYGTFCFYDEDAPEAEFAEWEVSFVDLISNWAGTELTRQQAQTELQRQNERLDEFTSVVSHDLRNPLQVLETSLDLVAQDTDQAHADRCRRAVDRMQRLIDDLLALARGGEEVVTMAPVDLGQLAHECWETAAIANATLNVETSRLVSADDEKLRQLLENLLSNAVEHGSTSPDSQARQDAVEHGSTSSRPAADDAVEHGADDGGTVTVTVADLDDGQGFAVSDDGDGIPPEERDRVFDAGYSTRTHGTGFGLPIVKQVADLHEWDVTVTESEAGGARFEIRGVDPA